MHDALADYCRNSTALYHSLKSAWVKFRLLEHDPEEKKCVFDNNIHIKHRSSRAFRITNSFSINIWICWEKRHVPIKVHQMNLIFSQERSSERSPTAITEIHCINGSSIDEMESSRAGIVFGSNAMKGQIPSELYHTSGCDLRSHSVIRRARGLLHHYVV